MYVLGQMRHKKSRSMMRVEGFWSVLLGQAQRISRFLKSKIEVLECVSRKHVQKFSPLAFRKGIAHRIISRSLDILRVCPGMSHFIH